MVNFLVGACSLWYGFSLKKYVLTFFVLWFSEFYELWQITLILWITNWGKRGCILMQWQVFSTKVTGHGFGLENQIFFWRGRGGRGGGGFKTIYQSFYFLWERLSTIYISHMLQKVKILRTEYNFLLLSLIEVKL